MYVCDTGTYLAIKPLLPGDMKHCPNTSLDEAGKFDQALGVIRKTEHGNGEICFPLINGFCKKVRIMIEDLFEKPSRKLN